MCAPLLVYAVLRAQSPALTPATAPWFYRPTADLQLLAWNALRVSRSRRDGLRVRRRDGMGRLPARGSRLSGRLVVAGVAWFVVGYALTARGFPCDRASTRCFRRSAPRCSARAPSMRSARRARPGRPPTPGSPPALASLLALVPVYRNRNNRWVEPARLSARAIEAIAANPPPGIRRDRRRSRTTTRGLRASPTRSVDFAGDALHEATHRALAARIENGGARWAGPVAARYRLTRGRIDRVSP